MLRQLLTLSVLLPAFWLAAQTNVPRGCTTIAVAEGSNILNLTFKNKTGKKAGDIRLTLGTSGTDAIPSISELDVTEGPGALENGDRVDDNNNGRRDDGENDTMQNPASTTSRSIFNSRVKPDDEIEVQLVLTAAVPDSTHLTICFSDRVNGRHGDIISAAGIGLPADAALVELPPAGRLVVLELINTTDQLIGSAQVASPELPLTPVNVLFDGPYDGSSWEVGAEGETTLEFLPPLGPLDRTRILLEYAQDYPFPLPLLVNSTAVQEPKCQLNFLGATDPVCTGDGTYSLGIELEFEPQVRYCREYTFTNNTGQSANDLHVLFSGTGGHTMTSVIDQPDDCGPPAIPSNGKVTNVVEVVWDSKCIDNGESVTLKVCTVNGPLRVEGGQWTCDGKGIGKLRPGDIDRGEESGLPGQDFRFLLDNGVQLAVTPRGTGPLTYTLTNLPADGQPIGTLTVSREGPAECLVIADTDITAPLCDLDVLFALQAVDQLDMSAPLPWERSSAAALDYTFFNPGQTTDLFLNVGHRPAIAAESDWILQNIPLPAFGDTLQWTSLFDLDPFRQLPPQRAVEEVLLNIYLTPTPLTELPPADTWQAFPVGRQEYHIGALGAVPDIAFSELVPPDLPPYVLPPIIWPPVLPPIEFKEYGCDMPNIDLSGTGDIQACGPAAATNSYSWLRMQHMEIDSILTDSFGNDAGSMRKLLASMKMFMGFTPETGTTVRNFILGKQAFADHHRLRMRVKYQSVYTDADYDSPIPDYGHVVKNENRGEGGIDPEWIFGELCEGEDVEALIDCYLLDEEGKVVTNPDGTTFLAGSHCVTVTGMYRVGDVWGMTYKDDPLQDKQDPQALRQGFTWLENDTAPGKEWRYVLQDQTREAIQVVTVTNDDGTTSMDTLRYTVRCFLGDVVSESFDPDVTFTDVADHPAWPGLEARLQGNPVAAGTRARLQVSTDRARPLGLRLHTADGRLIHHRPARETAAGIHLFELPTGQLPAGLYLLQLYGSEGQQYNWRLVVQ